MASVYVLWVIFVGDSRFMLYIAIVGPLGEGFGYCCGQIFLMGVWFQGILPAS